MNSNEHFKIDISKGLVNPKCVFKGSKYRISVLSDCLLRLEYNENGVFNDYPTIFAINRKFEKEPSFIVKQDDKFLNITNNYFILEYTKEKPFIASKLVPDSTFRISVKDTDKTWYFNNPEVRNYKGSTYSFDYNNNGSFTLDKGLYNVDGFASFDDSNRPVFVSDGSIKKNPSEGLDYYVFIYKNNFQMALESYFELTGKPALLPRFALGVWWNKNENYTANDLINLTKDFKRSEVPVSSILLNENFKKENKDKEINSNYEFDTLKYPNIIETIKELHQDNVYLGLKLNTSLGINQKDAFYPEAKRIMKLEKDEIIPVNVYNNGFILSYITNVINVLESYGVDYFWIDNISKDKTYDFILAHYLFTNYSKNEKRRGLILTRNFGIASHRYPIMYSGKTDVSWKTLKYLPYFNITSSNIGLNYWSHDIGGYQKGIEDAELYTRYVQLGTYSPIFRFSSKEGKYYKREPWKWDVKTEKIVSDYTKLRHRLIPYMYSECYKYSTQSKQLIKPLYYTHPEVYDEPLYKNEYYLGSEFLISPITESKDSVMNRVLHRIFLPKGTWYDFTTGKKFPGDKRYATFYRDEDYPVYAKSGAIIPLAILDEENLNDTKPPKKMEIQVFPGESNSYNLYEDDGVTNLYKQGYYIITNIDYNYRQNNYTLIIRPIEGKTGIIPEKRDYKIRFRNTKLAEDVKVNVNRYSVEFESYTDQNDFVIEIKDVPTRDQLTINCGGKAIEIDAVRIINEDIEEIISDLQIETTMKEKVADILFSDETIRKKRIQIRKLKHQGLNNLFVKMFIKLLEYISEI